MPDHANSFRKPLDKIVLRWLPFVAIVIATLAVVAFVPGVALTLRDLVSR